MTLRFAPAGISGRRNLTTTGITGQVARGGQTTIAQFFASGGTTINQPEPALFFEFPIVVMPKDYSYIP